MNKLMYAELDKNGNICGAVATTLADAQNLREVEGLNLKAVLVPWDGYTDEEREARRAECVERAKKYREAQESKKVITYENFLQYCNAYAKEAKKVKRA